QSTPVVADLAAAVGALRPALTRLPTAAQDGRDLLRDVGRTAPRLTRTLDLIKPLADPAPATFNQLEQALCEVNPALRFFKPWAPDLTSFLVNVGSWANSYDAIGHLVRLAPVLSENSLVGLPKAQSEAAFKLLHAGLLGNSMKLTYRPITKPGQIAHGEATASEPSVFGPEEFAKKSGYKYPDVKADC
ncbi:MAG: Mammalian cell entry related protein, partial [Solirubrobacterales bacterium]|nr:Mammalian cell entry related protein [Solirubrobacterales bacterium]